MDTQSKKHLHSRILVALAVGLAFAGTLAAGAADGERPDPTAIKVRITHRIFLEFADTLTVEMNERMVVGDTESEFEVIEFYPQFAIDDSTKTIFTLSDEPKNPAFKIRVFEGEEQTEDTWAFYGIDIPHFGRTSYLAFQVLAFEYRGTVLGGDDAVKAAPKGEEREK